tara:strand:+ start:425 stop:796 length:372 start_codon:yes stop_codon:yes gene_type:complete
LLILFYIYHNPRCRKSREALQLLKEQKVNYEIVLYLENPLSKNILQSILKKINLEPSAIVRKNEREWKDIPNREKMLEDQILNTLVSFPKLIERPIVLSQNKGVLARPIENLIEFLMKEKVIK